MNTKQPIPEKLEILRFENCDHNILFLQETNEAWREPDA